MDSQESVNEWLENTVKDGVYDSEGAFTISEEKAWEKLGRFQLPTEEAWILKFVQAAHCQKKAKLSFKFAPREVEFNFGNLWPSDQWSRVELEKAIFSTEPITKESLSHFVVAIHSLILQKDRVFSLCFPDGSVGLWKDRKVTYIQGMEPYMDFSLLVRVSTLKQEVDQPKPLKGEPVAPNYMRRVESLLDRSCFLHDGRLTSDGTGFGGIAFDPKFGTHRRASPSWDENRHDRAHTLAIFKQGPVEGLPVVQSNPTDQNDMEAFVGPNYSLTYASPESKNLPSYSVAACLSIFYNDPRRKNTLGNKQHLWELREDTSEVLWVDQGVVIARDTLPLKGHFGIAFIVSADGLNKDLSGLALINSKAKQERVVKALKIMIPQITDHLSSTPIQIGKGNRSVVTGPLLLGVTGVAFFLVNPIFAATLVGGSAVWYNRKRNSSSNKDELFSTQLKALKDQLSTLVEEYRNLQTSF